MFRIAAVVLILTVAAALPVMAADENEAGAAKDRVLDYASVLTAEQEAKLNGHLEKASEAMSLDLVFLTTNDTGGRPTENYAADIYDNVDGTLPERFGYGETFDGLMLCIDFDNREVYYLGTGRGEDYTSYEQTEYVLDQVWDYVSGGDYYSAGVYFMSAVEQLVNYGLPKEYEDYPYAKKDGLKIFGIETPYTASDLFGKALLGVIIGLIIAAIAVSSMKSKLKSVKLETGASGYAVKNSLNLTGKTDNLMYSNVVTAVRQSNNGSSGRTGGSRPSGAGHSHSSFSGSSGTHHSGGGRKF